MLDQSFIHLGNHALLTREEERQLFIKLAEGTKAQKKAARDKLILSNLRLVTSLTRKNAFPEDAFCFGVIGLMVAIDRFKIDTGNRLSTYATWWIRQSVSRSMRMFGKMIYAPSYISARLGDAINLRNKLEAEGKHIEQLDDTTISKLVDLKKLDISTFRSIYNWLNLKMVGLDATETPEWMLSTAPTPPTYEVDEIDTLKKCLAGINSRDRKIVLMRFGLKPYHRPHTLDEIGRATNLSRERIRQVQEQILRKLKYMFTTPTKIRKCVRI